MSMLAKLMMAVLGIQALTMLILGGYFWHIDQWRLSLAQILLAGVTVILYSGGL